MVLAGLALAVSPAFGQDEKVDCDNAMSTSDLLACAGEEYDTADKALNAAYREAMKRVEEADRNAAEMGPEYVGAVDALKSAQRAWITYRDGHCKAVSYSLLGGSAQPLEELGCQTSLTQHRTQELKDLLADR